MANYNADIRVGITGKTQLNALERQLGRINKDLNQINRSLKAQTLTINTRGATRALDQLDRKINKLNRSINVNANINERRSGGGGGGGGGFNAGALAAVVPLGELKQRQQISEKMLKDAKERIRDGKKAQAEVNKILDTYNELANTSAELNRAQAAYTDKTEKLADLTRQRNAALGQAKGLQTRLTKGQIKNADAVKRAKIQMAEYKALASDLSAQIGNANKGYGNQNRLLEKQTQLNAKRIAQEKNLEKLVERTARRQVNRERFKKGFGAGAGLAGASAAGNIPVLGDAVTGGLVASLSGGSVAAGALGGAIVGIGAAAIATTADVTTFNNALLKQQRALSNTVSTAEELDYALNAIERASDDFLVPIGKSTEQFTKLNAAARASGFTVEEVEEVYRGLAAANTALGGDSEKLQGILLATQQVFSKGKVQAEELRGQIGERLPGAFSLFAEAIGKTPAELDKALERGEVTLQDFVTFARTLLERYEDDAKKIADAPENAAERLKLAMDDLRRSMGPIVTDIGNMFIEMANTIITSLARAFEWINKTRLEAAKGTAAAGNRNVNETVQRLGEMRRNQGTGLGQASQKEIQMQEELLANQIALRNEANATVRRLEALQTPDLQPTADPLKPKSKLTPNPNSKTGSGSGPRDTTADLQAAIAAQRVLLEIEQQRFGLTERELELRSFDEERRRVEAELAKELAQIQNDNITAESKILASTLAQLKAKTDLQQIDNQQQLAQSAISQDMQKQLEDLELQIAIEEAITDEMRDQIRLAARIKEIQDGPGSEGDKQKLIDAENRLQAARDGNQGVSGYMKQLESELMNTEAMIVSLAQTVETELSSAMSSAITGLITGTQTAEEAFAQMFANIGKAFIDMATQMIAKALVLKALGILTGGTSGGTTMSNGTAVNWTSPDAGVLGSLGFSEGGFVTGPTSAVIGEAGESEYVIPASKMDGAMARYSSGARGESVVSGADSDSSGGGVAVADAPLSINISGGVTQMGGTDYIRKDELPSIINQSSKAGEARALRRLRQSPSTRRSIGL